MKKTFNLTHAKIKYPRLIEAAKADIRKYVKRERRRELPAGIDFLDFDCRFGPNEAEATVVHLTEITKCIDKMEAEQATTFYVEVIGKHKNRTKKPTAAEQADKPPAEAPTAEAESDTTSTDPWSNAPKG